MIRSRANLVKLVAIEAACVILFAALGLWSLAAIYLGMEIANSFKARRATT